MIQALFLDAAGTLIEPAEPVAEVYARTAAAFGQPVEPALVKKWFRLAFGGIGDPEYAAYPDGDAAEREWWGNVVLTVFNKSLGTPLPEGFFRPCFEALFAHYADPAAWRVFPEVPGVLADARAAGLRLAVVSNFDLRLRGILAGHGLHFDEVITSADACARKPDFAIFRMALDRLGLHPHEVLHAGDSPVADMEGAGAAGIEACLIERPASDLRTFLSGALGRCGK
ncbi:HAD family hydrolase [Luteolibacter arcticus]|uniref:HAD family hydrolase n=1 Tax=Luteolibacter arcticus TaxID=1581411 RepID=A0ABT3GIR6_9BACT|nr:HAD family hydrolase [Luteolibacter arcticus]MCW1923423.1 HAD family hydrolase [Luteolibacter arcticus]